MTARSNVWRLAFLALLLSRAPRSVRAVNRRRLTRGDNQTWPTETRLPGWGGRILTQKCRRKLAL
jgi:hypothetical protein